MSEEKKITPAEPGNDVNRRAFFVKLGLGSLGIAAAGTAAFSYQFLSPNVLYEPSPIVNAGKPENYAVDSVTLDANTGIYLIHDQKGFYALSAVCTHLGCLTAWKPELDIIACPCQGSGLGAGPAILTPSRLNLLPWQGQAMMSNSGFHAVRQPR